MRNEEYKHINLIRSKIVPDAHKKQYGSYLSFDDKSISPGCMACKTGGWLCCFIGTNAIARVHIVRIVKSTGVTTYRL